MVVGLTATRLTDNDCKYKQLKSFFHCGQSNIIIATATLPVVNIYIIRNEFLTDIVQNRLE